MRIVVGQRDAVEFLLGLLAQGVDDVLRDARHHERLQIRKYLIANVQDDEDEQNLPKQIEVHTRAWLAIGNRDAGPEYLRRGQTQLARREYVEDRGDDGADEHENDLGNLGLDERE